jgi:hypothetical protein
MKLFEFKHWDDFGLEVIFRLLKFKRFIVFSSAFHHSDYFDWQEPNIGLSIGLFGRSELFGITLRAWNVSIDIDLFQWNLYYDPD